MVSCQKGPTRHAYAWQIGRFWQDTLDISNLHVPFSKQIMHCIYLASYDRCLPSQNGLLLEQVPSKWWQFNCLHNFVLNTILMTGNKTIKLYLPLNFHCFIQSIEFSHIITLYKMHNVSSYSLFSIAHERIVITLGLTKRLTSFTFHERCPGQAWIMLV